MEETFPRIDWSNIKAVIFDVDGTLYDQRKLRARMLAELMKFYLTHPLQVRDMKILQDFRRERENHALEQIANIEDAQYEWAAKISGVSEERVRNIVKKWIFQIPLQHLPACRFPGVAKFFDNLSRRGIATALFSDYPAQEKVAALGLSPDCIVCSTDRNVDRLKPDPKGLMVLTEILRVSVQHCAFLGDRDERDGECARRAGMPYVILERRASGKRHRFQNYDQLNRQLACYSPSVPFTRNGPIAR